jgi:hypothetical protein
LFIDILVLRNNNCTIFLESIFQPVFERFHLICQGILKTEDGGGDVSETLSTPAADDRRGTENTILLISNSHSRNQEVEPEFTKLKERKVLKPCK